MRKILIVGNPNVGKSTLFNSLTKSSEHTGNFHGVTVEEKRKIVRFGEDDFEFVDLPGLYSLNTISEEEEISKTALLKSDSEVFVVVDANSLRKNLYLCQQLNEIGVNFKILLNNYDYFQKNNKKLNNKINLEILKNNLNSDVLIINAKKIKLNNKILNFKNKKPQKNYNYLEKYIKIIKNKYNLDEKTIILALNGMFNLINDEQKSFIVSLYPDLISDRYAYIDSILKDSIQINNEFTYGRSKADKIILNPIIAFFIFISTFFVGFYGIFFVIGPLISGLEEKIFNFFIAEPLMNLICLTTDNVWLIEFVNGGILNSIGTVISFVPQVALMFIFLSMLEDSGLISRFAYVSDDFLNLFGLNGKAVYTMLLGLGCNTMATSVTKNIDDKNLKIKSAIINPYISCMARLPVYSLIASAFFGKNSFFVIFALYVLGLVIALIMSAVLNKTILKNKTNELLLEFPPMRGIDFKHIIQVGRVNSKDFFKRIFTVILSMGVIIWILSHTSFNLEYTQNISNSILFLIANKLKFLFAPIGLDNAGIVSALIVGVLAKELIVSTISICNNTSSQKTLIQSLLLSTSVINLSLPSAVSFLIFTLLYSPCVSNLTMIKKETNKFFMCFSLLSQFTVAYMLSFIVYQAMRKGIGFAVVISVVISLIMFALFTVRKRFVKKCNGRCVSCSCNKKS